MAGSIVGSVAGAVVSSVIGGAMADDGGGGGYSQADAASAQAALKQAEIAEKQWNYYEQNFQPFEKDYLLPVGKQMIDNLNKLGSVEEQERAAGEASTAIASAMGKAKASMDRNMASYGINPTSGRAADANLKLSLEGARADATMQNAARKGVRDEAWGKKLDSINTALNIGNLGRGLPSSAMTGLSSAASTNANIAQNQFNRSQELQAQARAGVAPVASAIGKGVQNWFDKPSVDSYDSYVARAASNGFGPAFTNMADPAYG